MKPTVRKGWRQIAALLCAAAMVSGCTVSTVTEPSRQSKEYEEEKQTKAEKQTETKKQSEAMKGGSDMEALKPEDIYYPVDDYENWNQLLEDNKISKEFQNALKGFTYESGSKILSGEKGNVNYSPLSLYYALAIAGSGAEGETAAQILGSLGIEDQEELALQCKSLYQWWYYYEQRQKLLDQEYGEGQYKSSIQLGNSLWISHDLNVNNAYQNLAASQFFAPSYYVDFKSAETGERMGQWISEQTNGVLQPKLDLDSETVMAILNTLYFYGSWQNPFDKARTGEDIFTLKDGTKINTSYLNRGEENGAFIKEDGYTLSYLSTTNQCSMVFLLPDSGLTVEEFISSKEKLEEAMDTDNKEWLNGKVTWKVPRFSFGSSLKLAETLKDMGMETMFHETAQFTKISPDPLLVSDVIQETHIGIDEEGVEGAAYTMMAVEGSALLTSELSADMILDRPFIYGIQDNSSGAWLFLGVCQNPEEGE